MANGLSQQGAENRGLAGHETGSLPAGAGIPAGVGRSPRRSDGLRARRSPNAAIACRRMWAVASSMSSVTSKRRRSSRPIVRSAAIACSISTNGRQYAQPIRTMGKFRIFPVWMSVSASANSSSVPKPPGNATNAYEVLEQEDLSDKEVMNGDRAVDVTVRRLLYG